MTTYTIQYLTTSAAAVAGKESKLTPLTESTTARTLVLTDASKYIRCTNGAAVSITVPPQASVVWPSLTRLVIEQSGAGIVTLLSGAGVTLNEAAGLSTTGQYSTLELFRTAPDEWTITSLPGTGGGGGGGGNLDFGTFASPSGFTLDLGAI